MIQTLNHQIQMRKAMLQGNWAPYLRNYMSQVMDRELQAQIKVPSLAYNLLKLIIDQTATLYDRGVNVSIIDQDRPDLELIAQEAFEYHQSVLALMLAVRDVWVYLGDVEVEEDITLPRPMIYTPDQLEVECDEDHHPLKITIRGNPFKYVYDISDITAPKYYKLNQKDEVSEVYDYRWFHRGQPYLPFVHYGFPSSDSLYTTEANQTLVDATLSIATSANLLDLKVGSSSYGIKFLRDVSPVAFEMSDVGGAVDQKQGKIFHNSLLQLQTDQDKQGEVGVLQPSVEPEKEYTALTQKIDQIMRLLGYSGLSLSISSESGVALKLKRQHIDEMRQKMEPIVRPIDERYLTLYMSYRAWLLNEPEPTDTYIITYPAAPLSAEDQKTQMDLRSQKLQLIASAEALYASLRDKGVIDEDTYFREVKSILTAS